MRLLSLLSPPPLSMCPLLQIIMAQGWMRKCKELRIFGEMRVDEDRNTSAQEAEEGWWRERGDAEE